MSFAIYIVGFLMFIGALVYAGVLIGIPTQWIAVGALALAGIGVLTGVKATRQKDSTP